MMDSDQLQDFSRAPEDHDEESSEAPVKDTSELPGYWPAAEVPIKSKGQDRDTEVFNRFLAGNDEAFRILYDLYERPLYQYVIRLVSSEADAQDVFQEIWARMFRLRGERKEVTKFSGLLFTVARNLSINAIRDRKVVQNVSLEDVSADLEASLRTLDVDQADLHEMLQKALARLPLVQREAFILREYNGYSYQEIAEITISTMINAKMRAWRARERLRKMIAAWLELKSSELSEP